MFLRKTTLRSFKLDIIYAGRFTTLQFHSLEYRRLIFDSALCYEIVRNLDALDFDEVFTYPNLSTTRGHPFNLAIPIDSQKTLNFVLYTHYFNLECLLL